MVKKKVGFIGVGAMGKPMVKNLLKAGYQVTVQDLNPQPVEELISLGVRKAKTPAETALGVEVVITMLPGDAEVKAVVLGPEGVLERASKGSLLLSALRSLKNHADLSIYVIVLLAVLLLITLFAPLVTWIPFTLLRR